MVENFFAWVIIISFATLAVITVGGYLVKLFRTPEDTTCDVDGCTSTDTVVTGSGSSWSRVCFEHLGDD